MIQLAGGPEIYEVVVSNRVTEGDVEDLIRTFEPVIGEGREPRVLCTVSEFWGFDSEAILEELRYWLKCLRHPARVALLAEDVWLDRLSTSMFRAEPGTPTRTAGHLEVRSFGRERDARRWLDRV